MPRDLQRRRSSSAFSLIELLVVVGLISIMLVLTIPSLSGIMRGSGMKRAVSEVSSALDFARAQAMASSTWVWIGFADTSSNNTAALTFITVASKDGTTNTATSNLSVLTKPLRVENVKLLETRSTLVPNITTAVPLKNGDVAFTVTANNQSQSYSGTVLAFSPRGEAILKYSGNNPWIEVGLVEMRGGEARTNMTASVLTSGLSGQQVVTY